MRLAGEQVHFRTFTVGPGGLHLDIVFPGVLDTFSQGPRRSGFLLRETHQGWNDYKNDGCNVYPLVHTLFRFFLKQKYGGGIIYATKLEIFT